MTDAHFAQGLLRYAAEHSAVEPPLLARLHRETYLKVPQAIMLSGHTQGLLLRFISMLLRPAQVLEIGTFTGYSAICLAAGLPADGHLHTIDINEDLRDMAFRYFCEAGLQGQITQHIGPAADILPTLTGVFDLVFIDADKQNYELYYDMVFDQVAPGGFILADNVLYNAEVVLPPAQQSPNALAMGRFNARIAADSRVEPLLLPLRDGMMLIRKNPIASYSPTLT
jgi:predicted O-methyltransferase YrrM